MQCHCESIHNELDYACVDDPELQTGSKARTDLCEADRIVLSLALRWQSQDDDSQLAKLISNSSRSVLFLSFHLPFFLVVRYRLNCPSLLFLVVRICLPCLFPSPCEKLNKKTGNEVAKQAP